MTTGRTPVRHLFSSADYSRTDTSRRPERPAPAATIRLCTEPGEVKAAAGSAPADMTDILQTVTAQLVRFTKACGIAAAVGC